MFDSFIVLASLQNQSAHCRLTPGELCDHQLLNLLRLLIQDSTIRFFLQDSVDDILRRSTYDSEFLDENEAFQIMEDTRKTFTPTWLRIYVSPLRTNKFQSLSIRLATPTLTKKLFKARYSVLTASRVANVIAKHENTHGVAWSSRKALNKIIASRSVLEGRQPVISRWLIRRRAFLYRAWQRIGWKLENGNGCRMTQMSRNIDMLRYGSVPLNSLE